MGKNYYLAVDIGASSGRHMLSHMENGKMILEEIYRFPNGMVEKNGHKVWDVDKLFEEILTGMKKCALAGKSHTAWALTPGQSILSCWMKMTGASGMQWHTGTDGRKEWTGGYMASFQRRIYI